MLRLSWRGPMPGGPCACARAWGMVRFNHRLRARAVATACEPWQCQPPGCCSVPPRAQGLQAGRDSGSRAGRGVTCCAGFTLAVFTDFS